MEEPLTPRQGGNLEAALIAGHWTSVTPEEKLYYYNPEKVYPKVVGPRSTGVELIR